MEDKENNKYLTNKEKMITVFEQTSPYEFLRIKNRGASLITNDIKIVDFLLNDIKLKPAVVNVLIDYVLKVNNNKLAKPYIEAIAIQWKRSGIETAKDAMDSIIERQQKKIKNNKKNIEDKTEKERKIEEKIKEIEIKIREIIELSSK